MKLAVDYPEESARWVRDRAKGGLRKLGWLNLLPSQRKIDQLVRAARSGDDPIDQPWSMAACQLYDIPPDAFPDLLAIWKRAIIGDTTSKFTIRVAVWAVRLRYIVTGPTERERIDELYQFAMLYAGEERIAKLLKQDFDTSFLDSNLAFRKGDGSFDWALWEAASRVVAFHEEWRWGRDRFTALLETTGGDGAKSLEMMAPSIDSDEVREIREMIRACPLWPRIDTELAKGLPELWDEVQSANAMINWREDLLILQLRRFGSMAAWREMAKEERQRLIERLVGNPSSSMLIDICNELGDTEYAETLLKVLELMNERGLR